MNKQIEVVKIFCLSQSSKNLEWLPLISHKYQDALNFKIELTDNMLDAQIIVWDGLVSPKASVVLNSVIEQLQNKKATLFYSGEERTLFKSSSFSKYIDISLLQVENIPARPLPEEILFTLDSFWKKKRSNV